MTKALEVFLGIMTALGAFVDIGELVFSAQAGARFGHALLWVVPFATVGIIVYSEMAGRIAAVAKRPVLPVIERELGRRAAFAVWLASTLISIATCAGQIGALAIVFRLLAGFGPPWITFVVALVLGAMIWFLPFKWIERVFGFAGLAMLVFIVAAIAIGPDWSEVGRGLVPGVPDAPSTRDLLMFGYFVAGITSSLMMPYELYFYASGGVEERWKRSDLPVNRAISTVGMSVGALITMAIIVLGAEVFAPRGIDPDTVGTPALLVGSVYGRIGIVLGLVGILTGVASAAVENALSGAYNLAQFFRLPWGRARPARETPAFDAAWIGILALGALIPALGVDPILVVEASVMVAVICLPLTYWPVLSVARNRRVMGRDHNGPVTNALGWFYLVVISLAAIAAPVLMVLTGMGSY